MAYIFLILIFCIFLLLFLYRSKTKEYREILNTKKKLNSVKEELKFESEKLELKKNRYEELQQEIKKSEENYLTLENKQIEILSNLRVYNDYLKREKEEDKNFNRMVVSDKDLKDIRVLNIVRDYLNNSSAISKIIWSSFIINLANDLCIRVLGKEQVSGIYKITNIETKRCYIGQSVNVADRWKKHIKCGLGIDASATNKLYKDMLSVGVWNFDFELLEECEKNLLNEREKFWIDAFEANTKGYNTQKGNK